MKSSDILTHTDPLICWQASIVKKLVTLSSELYALVQFNRGQL